MLRLLSRRVPGALLAAACTAAPLRAQAAPAAAAAAAADTIAQPPRVYLDCTDFRYCDSDFFRTEIAFVNWVRVPQAAEVHVLVTSQTTGGGGTEFTLAFIGRERWAGAEDTLRYVAPANASQDVARRGLARTIGLGLVRFAARSPVAERLTVTYAAPAAQSASQRARDPWDHWVFTLSANGNVNGEKTYHYFSVWPSLSADRVTEDWKLTLSFNGSYGEQKFDYGADLRSSFYQHSYGSFTRAVRSLGPHWSAGVSGGTNSSSYQNTRLALFGGPAVEYDIFPYAQSTRRLLTLRYSVSAQQVHYETETIYFREQESLLRHSLDAETSVTQPWGSVFLAVSGGQFLDHPSKWSGNLFGNVRLQVVKGLSLNGFGGYSAIRDQLYLSAEGATRDEILLRQRAVATTYSYWGGFGVSYSFGSIYNNVVNPRFGRGGMVIF